MDGRGKVKACPLDAEPFVEEVRGDDPEVAAKLSFEERELEAVSRMRVLRGRGT